MKNSAYTIALTSQVIKNLVETNEDRRIPTKIIREDGFGDVFETAGDALDYIKKHDFCKPEDYTIMEITLPHDEHFLYMKFIGSVNGGVLWSNCPATFKVIDSFNYIKK